MIHWAWLILAVVAGVWIGIGLMCILRVSGDAGVRAWRPEEE